MAAAAARAGIAPLPDADEADELVALIAGFAAGELCARLGRARPTSAARSASPSCSGSGVLITGALDVLAREPGGRMLIVDYKSDRLQGADPATIVGARLRHPAAGLRAGGAARRRGRRVEVVHCFLERPQEPVMASFASAQTPGARARARALAAGGGPARVRGQPEPHRALCAGCPAEGGLCSWPLSQTRRESPDRLF